MRLVLRATSASLCVLTVLGCDSSADEDTRRTMEPSPDDMGVRSDASSAESPEPGINPAPEALPPASDDDSNPPNPNDDDPSGAPGRDGGSTPSPSSPTSSNCDGLPTTCVVVEARDESCTPLLDDPSMCALLDERCELRECYLACLEQPCTSSGLVGANGDVGAQDCLARCERSFYCDGQFLAVEKLCDGVDDCPSGRDELDEVCAWPDVEFQCYPNEAPATRDQLCDGIADCPRGEDEPCADTFACQPCSCAEGASDRCPPAMDCGSGDTVSLTVTRQQLSDGIADCPLGEDEHLPEQLSCADRSREQWCELMAGATAGYLCRGTGTRVPRRTVCDGVADCPEGDDEPCGNWAERCPEQHEWVAAYLQELGTRDLMGAVLAMENDLVCSLSESPESCPFLMCDAEGCRFPCSNGQMLHPEQVADGVPNCPGGEDEPCAPAFRCPNGLGIPFDRTCNGEDDCADGADERDCPRSPEPFICGDGTQVVFPALACPERRCNDLSDTAACVIRD